MKLLFDQGTPKPLRRALPSHQVSTAFAEGWARLRNGDLLAAAEAAAFDAIVTTDQSLRYQQNLSGRRLAIVVLMTTQWPHIQSRVELVADAVDALTPAPTSNFTSRKPDAAFYVIHSPTR